MKIECDKWYLTRCGEKVRVVCVDASHPLYPVIGVANCFSDGDTPYAYTAEGVFDVNVENGMDLVSEYVEPPKPREIWVNIYQGGLIGLAWDTKERAEEVKSYDSELVLFREVLP